MNHSERSVVAIGQDLPLDPRNIDQHLTIYLPPEINLSLKRDEQHLLHTLGRSYSTGYTARQASDLSYVDSAYPHWRLWHSSDKRSSSVHA